MSDLNVIINQLIHKYSNNEHMTNKLHTYIKNLPILMSNIEEEHNKRLAIKETLNKNKDLFINQFLSNNLYFYIPQSELFIHYNSENYKTISEDDILHFISETINKYEPLLQQCKFKIKNNIIKLIKETPINSTIPESSTIQNILKHFYPSIFKSKNHIKHFLTILGDNILGKKDNLIYLVDHSFKPLIQTLSHHIFFFYNKNFTDCFKFKYSDHKYDLCRIINIHNSNFDYTFIKNHILDIIAVSCHYSKRYGSADLFLQTCNNSPFSNSVLYLKDKSPKNIVQNFLSDMTTNDTESSIEFKNMYYIWRQYLKNNMLPMIISQNNLKSILSDLLTYDHTNDTCLNIKCKYDTHWIHFQTFWTQNITVNDDDDNNYEISEITTLFNDWCISNSLSININEDELKEILFWNNPNLHIENDKHIHNITCKLWDKKTQIDISIQSMEQGLCGSFNTLDTYKYYCKFIAKNYNGKYIVSKSYFDKYLDK